MRSKRDLESIQWMRQSFADRLDERLLPRPAPGEGERLILRSELRQCPLLQGREELAGDGIHFGRSCHRLEVYAQRHATDCAEHQIAGVRDVEMYRTVFRQVELRFAEWPVAKSQAARFLVHI